VRALYKFTKTLKNQSWQYEPSIEKPAPDQSEGGPGGKENKPPQSGSESPTGN
jgi:hypothetical protein